ncbi:hypothetical protein LTR85_011165 [Meristemomyces frigidus]|nr:hypothetical protein LTR85_011165 [Meristemomyces frigidus]
MASAKSLSLMTGYQAVSTPVVRDPHGSELLNATTVTWATFVVEDGSRIGVVDQYGVVNGSFSDSLVLQQYMKTYEGIQNHQYNGSKSDSIPCWTSPGSVKYYCEFFGAPNAPVGEFASNITLLSTGETWSLSAPPLNITNNTAKSIVLVDSVSMSRSCRTYLLHEAECLPTSQYKWEFSSIMLFAFCVATLLFLAALQRMTWRMLEYSRSDRVVQPLNVYRDILDLAQALTAAHGQSMVDSSPSEIEEKMRCNGGFMELDTRGLPDSRHQLMQGEVRPVKDLPGFDLSPTWYNRIARLLSSHADDEVVVHWPGKRERVTAGRLVGEDNETLLPRIDGNLLATVDGVENAIALRTIEP